jgi:DNA repair photolyase
MPGINDAPEQVAKIVELATEAGATSIGGQTLFLRGSVRKVFFDWLREHRPDLLPRYEELYRRGAYLPEDQRREIERAAGVPWLRSGDRQRWKHRVTERRLTMERAERERAQEAAARRRGVSDAQEALF